MKRRNKKYVRTALLEYKLASEMVSGDFVSETEKAIKKIDECPKINLLTLNDRCRKLNFSFYKKIYASNLEIIKYSIEKICSLPIMSACLEYNNENLFHDFIKIKYLKDQKKKNNIYKSLNAYVNRVSYKSLYGGLMGFYSLAKSRQKNNGIFDKIKPVLIFEKNRFFISTRTELTEDFYNNPTIIKNGELIYFRYDSNKEQIVKIKNPSILNILQKIKNKKILNKLIELNIVSLESGEISEICFKRKGSLKFKNIKLNNKIKLNKNNVYDLINAATFNIDKNIYIAFERAANIYLDLLENQLASIHTEKKYLGNIVKKCLKKRRREKYSLLNFIIDYRDDILKLREKRKNCHYLFYKKFFSKIQPNKNVGEITFDNWRVKDKKIRKNLEFYFSTCKIQGEQYIVVENISPMGIFSSRFDYFIKDNHDSSIISKHDNLLEPIEIIFAPQNPELFHSFRRKRYTKFYLNINNFIKYPQKNILNINDVCIALNGDGLPVLYSSKLNKYFDPVIHSTLPAEQSLIVTFLRMISQSQEEVYELPKLLPNNNSDLDYIPRIIIENLILSKKIWRISTKDINVIKGSVPKYNEYLYLLRLFRAKKIPRFINIFSPQDSSPRPIDLYNPLSLLSFKKYSKEKFIYIEEMLPSPEHVDFFDKQIGHFNQYFYTFDLR